MGIYRPHSDSVVNFITALNGVLDSDTLRNKDCVLMGDFNVNLLLDDDITSDFICNMQSYHFCPLITHPTRFPVQNSVAPSLLDHIWVNNLTSKYTCGVIMNDLTDHCPVFLNLFLGRTLKSDCHDKVKISFRCKSEDNYKKFEDYLEVFNWNSIRHQDVNIYLSNFVEALNNTY